MSNGEPKSQAAFGFLTVLEHEQQGLVGGYLVLNMGGRPLEFHCTAPVKPNRAQQILFGPTLEPYLYGEQIGQTLLNKSTLEPLAVYTDVERALSVREFVSLPVALVVPPAKEGQAAGSFTSGEKQWRVDRPQGLSPRLNAFDLGQNRLAVPVAYEQDRQAIVARAEALAGFDLSEPFERIREALEEARKGARA